MSRCIPPMISSRFTPSSRGASGFSFAPGVLKPLGGPWVFVQNSTADLSFMANVLMSLSPLQKSSLMYVLEWIANHFTYQNCDSMPDR